MDSAGTLTALAVALPLAALSLGYSPAASAQHEHKGSAPLTDEQAIAKAMRAAPEAVVQDATIVVMEDGGKAVRTLRKGTNGFTCMPDAPTAPGPSAMCLDANAMAWAAVWISHAEPPAGKVGLIYMLAGGTDASNTDPYAQEPQPGNNWVSTGAHVMVVGAAKMMEGYPRDAMPDTTKPYVMWPGTPYEHLMLPVK